mgnify:CR=1 FL=1
MSLDHQEFLRYSRQMMVEEIGEEGQQLLKEARLMVVGLGGLGCPASLYLAAAGVGQLILADGDDIELSNLQRQVLYREQDVGQNKASTARRRLRRLNPHIEIEALGEHVDRRDLAGYLPECDLVLDCTDRMSARQEINRAAVATSTPLISASAIGWEGQLLELLSPGDETACLACIYGADESEPAQNCSTAGVIGPVLGMLGSWQALRAILFLTQDAEQEQGRMQRFDGRNGLSQGFDVERNPNCPVCSHED